VVSKLGMRKAFEFLRLIRPLNCIMMGVAVLAGAFVVRADVPSSLSDALLKFALGFLTAFTLSGASMAINDYWDRDIDKINEPSRPIPGGVISPVEGLIFAAVLTLIGFIAAILISPLCLFIAVVSWIISVSYNTKGKGTGLPGNFLVSSCVAVPFFYGSFIVRERPELSALIFAVLAFLSNTGREVMKGIVDIQGDRTRNIKTIAISHGERTAAYVGSTFYVLASGLSFLPVYFGLVSLWFLPFVLFADVGFVASSVMLIRDHSRENAKRIKNLALLWMSFVLLAIITGSITK